MTKKIDWEILAVEARGLRERAAVLMRLTGYRVREKSGRKTVCVECVRRGLGDGERKGYDYASEGFGAERKAQLGACENAGVYFATTEGLDFFELFEAASRQTADACGIEESRIATIVKFY